ncbi:class 1 fructose-bisphosphatase [Blattabacterium cuenoti]|uniref:class 1 fructose-bisphosphatase n=1 Tax=Blattabacterium cuenoti TaxID=1653831 RepID=UPI00163CBA30|nr:class 1 fructose-bisphosphatase [Blattabacterium cuenoti]
MYTLGEFIIDNKKYFSHSIESLLRLFSAIKLAAKAVHKEVNKAGLTKNIGSSGKTNIQGEQQQKLDFFAHNIFINSLKNRDIVCGIASEESKDFIIINKKENIKDKYIVLIDPLDGSSNIDVNVPIGTIFSVYKSKYNNDFLTIDDFLQNGSKQILAGYIIYGSSTILVYTTGNGVHGFTLDPSIGTFYLSHPDLMFPDENKIYSINDGNYIKFSNGIKKYIKYCQKEKRNGGPYTARYIGSLVGDFHRNMIRGGIYIYPQTSLHPKGKLRLLYECNPIAFITEQAGGKASNGYKRILEIEPIDLHQRTPFICGPMNMVSKLENFIKNYDE